jgi:hypothetical protein
MVPLDNCHVTIKEYSSKYLNSRFYVGTSDFFHEIQEKLVPKTFSSRCMVPLDKDYQRILEQNLNSRTDVGTSEFFHEIQEKLVPKTFSSRCMVPLDNGHVTEYTITCDADRWRCSGFFESFFFYIFERL